MLETDTLYQRKIDTENHLAQINAYYDSPAVQWFEATAKQQIHLGYWDDKYPFVSIENAAKRLMQVVIDFIGLPREGHFLDIGCGCGVTTMAIARQKHCYAKGVTINPLQQKKAQDMAIQSKLSHRLGFAVADGNALPYPDDSFDAVLLLESIHHIGHAEALKEAGRVLKPGGQLVIADGVAIRQGACQNHQQRLGELFVSRSLASARQCQTLMTQEGFHTIESVDLTRAVLPTWQKLMEETRAQQSRIIDTEGVVFYQELLAFWSEMKHLWRESARYILYTGHKP